MEKVTEDLRSIECNFWFKSCGSASYDKYKVVGAELTVRLHIMDDMMNEIYYGSAVARFRRVWEDETKKIQMKDGSYHDIGEALTVSYERDSGYILTPNPEFIKNLPYRIAFTPLQYAFTVKRENASETAADMSEYIEVAEKEFREVLSSSPNVFDLEENTEIAPEYISTVDIETPYIRNQYHVYVNKDTDNVVTSKTRLPEDRYTYYMSSSTEEQANLYGEILQMKLNSGLTYEEIMDKIDESLRSALAKGE